MAVANVAVMVGRRPSEILRGSLGDLMIDMAVLSLIATDESKLSTAELIRRKRMMKGMIV